MPHATPKAFSIAARFAAPLTVGLALAALTAVAQTPAAAQDGVAPRRPKAAAIYLEGVDPNTRRPRDFEQSVLNDRDREVENQKAVLASLRATKPDSDPEVQTAIHTLETLQARRDALAKINDSMENRRVAALSDQIAANRLAFDYAKAGTYTGPVVRFLFSPRYSWLTLDTSQGIVRVLVASSQALPLAGWNGYAWNPGEPVTVTGAPSQDDALTLQATAVSLNGNTLYKRPAVPMPQGPIGPNER